MLLPPDAQLVRQDTCSPLVLALNAKMQALPPVQTPQPLPKQTHARLDTSLLVLLVLLPALHAKMQALPPVQTPQPLPKQTHARLDTSLLVLLVLLLALLVVIQALPPVQ
jgi:hypothetical protein